MAEHTFLVAITVDSAGSREDAEKWLHEHLPRPGVDLETDGVTVESWWVAEDDRHDRSDCDSAVFVHPGSQEVASRLLRDAGLTESQFRSGSGNFDEPDGDEISRHLLPTARYLVDCYDKPIPLETAQNDRP